MGSNNKRIIQCKAKLNYLLWIKFADGLEGDVDLSDLVGKGVFKAWESKNFFDKVKINTLCGTVAWGEEIDLDSLVLRQEIQKST